MSILLSHRLRGVPKTFKGFGVSLLAFALLTHPAYSAPKGSAASQYLVTPLGTLNDPGSSAVVRRVNSLGEAVGGYKSDKAFQNSAAFILSSAIGFDEITDGQVTDFSALYGINDSGEVAGAMNGPSSVLPFRSVRHTGFQLLPLLDKDTSGAAYGINDSGEAVGYSGGGTGSRAAWWTRKGAVTALASLPGFTTTRALDINKKGDIVGYAGEAAKVAVLWPTKGSPTQLGTLSSYASTQAESISDNGDIVGSASAYDPTVVRMRAVLWPSGSTVPQDLGVLAGGVASRARDIDTNGLVVGTSDSTVGNRAFFWSAATGMQDLNTVSADPTLILVDAMSISKQGAILAIGINKSDLPAGDSQDVEEHELPRQIVLLTPVK
jgi:probable HAF family extracellular repeat protein